MKKNIYIALIALVLTACGKDPSGIPDVPVSFHISLDHPDMQPLSAPGGSVIINGYGVAGLIIYRSAFSGYKAYDRCSSVNSANKCQVKVDSNGLTVTDPCSGGVFSLEDGNPQKAPAEMPLKSYNISISSSRMISVIN